jgi:hypothetical protein
MPANFMCESEEFNGPTCKVQCASCDQTEKEAYA